MINNNSIYKNKITIITPDQSHKKLYKEFDVIDKKLIKTQIKIPYFIRSHSFDIQNVDDIAEYLKSSSHENYAVIRGARINPGNFAVRRLAKPTTERDGTVTPPEFYDASTNWIALDIDEHLFEDINDPQFYLNVNAINKFVEEVLPTEFHNVNYCYRFSSSAGISYNNKHAKKGLSCHIFFMLNDNMTSEECKVWLTDLRESKLIDSSLYQPVQPIFLRNAVLKNSSIKDWFKINNVPRVDVVYKVKDEVKVPDISIIREQLKARKLRYADSLKVDIKCSDELKNEILQKLTDLYELQYNDWRNLGWAMRSNGFDYCDFKTLTAQHRRHRNITQDSIEKVWSSGVDYPLNFGTIINIIRTYSGEDNWFPKTSREDPNIDVTQKYLDRIKEKNKKTVFEHSNGKLENVRKKLNDAIVDFKNSDSQAHVIITNTGVGKTIGQAGVFDKVCYARQSNKSVRELGTKLKIVYPDKNILVLFSFKEIFKEKWPDYKIINVDSEYDIFSPNFADWSATFDTMKPNDKEAALRELIDFQNNNKDIVFNDYDVICCTTTMLKLIWESKKIGLDSDELWKEPLRNLKIDKIINKSEEYLKFLETFFKYYIDNYEEYRTVHMLPTDFVIIIDDITGGDAYYHQKFKTGDDIILEKIEEYNKEYNQIIDANIKQWDNSNIKNKFPVLFDICRSYYNKQKRDYNIQMEVFDLAIFWKKFERNMVFNKNYRQVFTCAESVQVKQIENILKWKKIKYHVTDLTELQPVNNVLLIPTQLTIKKFDGLLYPIFNYIKRKYDVKDLEFIADGFGCENNHSNTKGRNDLQTKNIIFKVSRLHPENTKGLVKSILPNVTKSSQYQREAIEFEKMKGDCEQTIGRNAGWRDSGFITIGLVDNKAYDYITKNMFFDCEQFQHSNIEWVQELIQIIGNYEKWINNRNYSYQQFLSDCNIKKINDANDYKRLIRIYEAIKNLEQTKKIKNIIREFKLKIIEIKNFLNQLLIMTDPDIEMSDEYDIKILKGDVAKNLELLRSLNVLTKRIRKEDSYRFYLTQAERIELKLLNELL